MTATEKRIRITGVILCELFAVITIFRLVGDAQWERLFLAVITPLLILVPSVVEWLFRCKISLPVYLICLFYAIGPMLGHCYKLYYLLPGWDKMLHILGGVMFALFGFFLFSVMGGDSKKRWLAALFALCFSMAVAVMWEFVEFGADQLLGMDMQNDTIVHSIYSYVLGKVPGSAGYFEGIEAVTVNGTPLPFAGYLDIGLHDTMWDMLLETIGAAVTVGLSALGKGKHQPISINKQLFGVLRKT